MQVCMCMCVYDFVSMCLCVSVYTCLHGCMFDAMYVCMCAAGGQVGGLVGRVSRSVRWTD